MSKRGKPRPVTVKPPRRIALDDAIDLITIAEQNARFATDRYAPTDWRHGGMVAANMIELWRKSPVVLRADPDFVAALASSDKDVTLTSDWLRWMPFDAVAVSLAEPLRLHDGEALCVYRGFIATGVRVEKKKTTMNGVSGEVLTHYKPLARGEGVRCLWCYTIPGSTVPRVQTVTFNLEGELSQGGRTLAEQIAAQKRIVQDRGLDTGAELDVLQPLSLAMLLYLSAQDPDLERLAPDTYTKPAQLEGVAVSNLGWRVGANLRRVAHSVSGAYPSTDADGGLRTLPPHIRKAHWHRVRIATRTDDGQIVGNTRGTEGVDWTYQMRWYPPTAVNANGGDIAPVVRQA